MLPDWTMASPPVMPYTAPSPADPKGARQLDGRDCRVVHVRPGSRRSATALHQASSGSSTVRQDAVTRDRRYGPLMAKRSEGRKEGMALKIWCDTYNNLI